MEYDLIKAFAPSNVHFKMATEEKKMNAILTNIKIASPRLQDKKSIDGVSLGTYLAVIARNGREHFKGRRMGENYGGRSWDKK